jgi:hypothetical protein
MIALGVIPVEALEAAATRRPSKHTDDNVATIKAAVG